MKLGDINLRAMIVAHVRASDGMDNIGWLTNAYVFMVKHNIPPDDAIEGLWLFVDEVINAKTKRQQ